MSTNIVKAGAIIATVDGVSRYIYQGDPVPSGIDADELTLFVERGLIVNTGTADPEDVPAFPASQPSTEWSAEQLRRYIAERQIDGGKAKTKAELVAAIQAAEPVHPEAPVVETVPADPIQPGFDGDPVVVDETGEPVAPGSAE